MWQYLSLILTLIGACSITWAILSACEDIRKIRKVAERWHFAELAQAYLAEHKRQMDEENRRKDLLK